MEFPSTGRNAEEFSDETHFACDAGLQQDALAFTDHPHHLEAFDGGVGRLHRLEPERRSAQPLDRAVVSLDAVVEVFRLTVLDGPAIRIIPLQLPQRFAIGRVLVGVDDVRRPVLACPQGFRQEMPGCLGVAAVGQQEIDRPALLVDGSKQLLPLSVHPDTRLVDPPGAAGRALVPANLLLQLWSVALNPPPDGRVIDRDAAFRHHLLELTVADGVFAVPAHALEDDEGMEAAKLEGVHSRLAGSDCGLRQPTSTLMPANATWGG